MNDIYIPENIRLYINEKSFEIDDTGMSDAGIYIFDNEVLKIEKQCEESENAAKMMDWLEGRLPVPKIICREIHDNISYTLMTKAVGEMSCSEQYMRRPDKLTLLLAKGIKMLWDIDIRDCPCINRLDSKLAAARYNVENDLVDIENVQSDTFGENGFEDPAHLLEWLYANKPDEDLVLVHGDYCLPNVFINNGCVSGFIDLGRCGVSDRWQDIALCYRSLTNNFHGVYGKSFPGLDTDILFDELGIEPDREKLRYYILLDELF